MSTSPFALSYFLTFLLSHLLTFLLAHLNAKIFLIFLKKPVIFDKKLLKTGKKRHNR